MNRGTEDYLKTIYQLQEIIDPNTYVSNHSLGLKLGHKAQTVNEMIKKLVSKDLVIYKRYKGTRLTDGGREVAVKMLRKHRLWELFLTKELGYSWEEVHPEAERLEHVTSDLLEERIYHYLGEPKRCPHGNLIPNLQGVMTKDNFLKLDQGTVGNRYKLTRVKDEKTLLKYLDKIGFALGDVFLLLGKDPLNETLQLKKDGTTHFTLGMKVANQLYIQKT